MGSRTGKVNLIFRIMQLNSLSPSAFTGTIKDAAEALKSLPQSKHCLILIAEDMPEVLPDQKGNTPESLEEWLALITYSLLDLSLKTPNSEKLFNVTANPSNLDNGFFQPGKQFVVYSLVLSLYSQSSLSPRPGLSTL